jgi:hypothetical protein
VIADQDLVTSSKECLRECLSKPLSKFCQSADEISEGYCCKNNDCSDYGEDDDFGFCSDEALLSVVKMMSCPYEKNKCSSRGMTDQTIQVSTDGNFLNLQPNYNLEGREFCYYEIKSGKAGENPSNDHFLTMKISMLNNIRADLVISEGKTSEFVDFCYGIEEGDQIFARHPYKIFPVFEAKGDGSRFFVELQYQAPASVDLSQFVNSKRCVRV